MMKEAVLCLPALFLVGARDSQARVIVSTFFSCTHPFPLRGVLCHVHVRSPQATREVNPPSGVIAYRPLRQLLLVLDFGFPTPASSPHVVSDISGLFCRHCGRRACACVCVVSLDPTPTLHLHTYADNPDDHLLVDIGCQACFEPFQPPRPY